jgi:bifunctional non-homologous end joining protein LigD
LSLREYKRKRDFRSSPEPSGELKKRGNIYVIQKHDASHLHYDLRLQLDGVLKSWAVPKGPSLDPSKKRLAMQVEDHPVDYATFEGVIPEGYGAGEVIVWDYGTWMPSDGHDPRNDLKKGHLEFEINGEKLRGRWMLVRTLNGSPDKPQWLLMKRQDKSAKKENEYVVTEEEKESVLSGRKLARDSKEKKPATKKKIALPFVEPELALLQKNPPAGEQWLHEIKFDGYRTLARLENGSARLFTRKGLDWTKKYPSVQEALEKLNAKNAWIDGEVVVLNEKGQSDFQLLQENIKTRKRPFLYYVFDLLALNGDDCRDLPLEERKERLRALLAKNKDRHLIYSEHWSGPGDRVLKESCRLGLEGIISKDKSSTYISGRNGDWVKTKCGKGQEFVIIGYTTPGGRRVGFGSLLLGAHDKKGKLIYTGHVGTGFSHSTLRDLIKTFKPLKTKSTPVEGKIPKVHDVQWLKPELVAEVRFLNMTREGILRHPSFAGLRSDKPASEVQLDSPTNKKPSPRLSHPDKLLIPQAHVTKQDVAEYYQAVQKWMLPHVKDRPLALVRCPDGVGKECFFQKSLHDMNPQAVMEEKIRGQKGKMENVIFINTPAGLTGLTQIAVLEIHAWQTHRQNFLTPDQVIFDLDPGPGVKWKAVANAAFALRDLLGQLKLKSFVKTSGGKGLHIHVPIVPRGGWDEVKAFAKAVAQYMSQTNPKLYLAVMSKSKREKRIFIDYLRNGYGATAIVPYGLRAKPDAAVAMPVDWDLISDIKPHEFTIKNAIAFLQKQKRDPWRLYFSIKQKLPFKEIKDIQS